MLLTCTSFCMRAVPCAAVRAVEHEEPQAQGEPLAQQQQQSQCPHTRRGHVLIAAARYLPSAWSPPTRPSLTTLPLPPLQMGLGVSAVVLGGVGIPLVAVQMQFWKAKG